MLKHMYICTPHNFCRIDSKKCNCWDIGSKFLFLRFLIHMTKLLSIKPVIWYCLDASFFPSSIIFIRPSV